MPVNTTWVDPTKTKSNSGLDYVTGDTVDQAWTEGVASDLNVLGGTTGRSAKVRREWATGAAIASAATITLGTDGNSFSITGTTTITSITAAAAGMVVQLIFAGVLTVTNGSNLKLNGSYTTAANNTLTLISDGTNWIELARSSIGQASGQAVGSTSGPTTTSTTYVDLPDMSVTVTTTGGVLVAVLSATLVNGTGGNSTAMALSLDAATEVADQWGQNGTNSERVPFCVAYRWSGVAAGSHTVKGRWKSPNGSTIQADTTLRVLTVFEVK